jgi:hypothetical protein
MKWACYLCGGRSVEQRDAYRKGYFMRRTFLATAALIAIAAATLQPAAAGTYSWTLDAGGGLTGLGLLTTGAADSGGFDISSFTGTIGGAPVALVGGDPGASTGSPSGAFDYDNIVYTSADPVFDTWGVLFSVSGKEGNIWGNGSPGSYSYYTYNGSGYDYANDLVSFTLTVASGSGGADTVIAQEPSTLALFAFGLLGLTYRRRCR